MIPAEKHRRADATRVFIVDDSAVMRGIVRQMVESEPDIVIVGSAKNGAEALSLLDRVTCDVVLLDIEMPVMDGLTALPKIIEKQRSARVIMASTLTRRNAEITLNALRLGAADYVTKPVSAKGADIIAEYKQAILSRIRALSFKPAARTSQPPPRIAPRMTPAKPQAVAIGSSTGGPQALLTFFSHISSAAKQPFFVTQHMPAPFTAILAEHIGRACGRVSHEGVDGEPVVEGRVYVAPAGSHMLVERRDGKPHIVLSNDRPENFCRPAVDPMLRSLAHVYGEHLCALVFTGMGADGAKGCEEVVRAGGRFAVQDEATSIVWGMPGAAAKSGLAEAILPLGEIAPWLNRML